MYSTNDLKNNKTRSTTLSTTTASRTLAQSSRWTDFYETMAQCYIRIGNRAAAAECYRRNKQLLKEEWDFTFGKEIDELDAKISELSGN